MRTGFRSGRGHSASWWRSAWSPGCTRRRSRWPRWRGSCRAAAKRLLAPARARKAPCALVAAHSLAEFDDLLLRAGLLPARSSTFGFGPFTLLRLPVLPDRLGVALNARLQRLADDGTPGLLRGGNHYLVLARRPG